MRIARARKQQCATLSEVSVREDVAPTRLPGGGVPDRIRACLQPVGGADKAPVRLLGPASRAPEMGHHSLQSSHHHHQWLRRAPRWRL
eukprot:9119812-Pyramimonas_sp.AAC.1